MTPMTTAARLAQLRCPLCASSENYSAGTPPELRCAICHTLIQTAQNSTPVLRRADLNRLIKALEQEHGLGPRSFDVSSDYIDYVAFTMYCRVASDTHTLVRQRVEAFCATYKWAHVSVTARPSDNCVTVIMHQSEIICGGNARLPRE